MLIEEANEDARSRRSVAMSKASAKASQKSRMSMPGGAGGLKDRLLTDFGIQAAQDHLAQQQYDKISQVSALDSEIDEWAALNKYAVLKDFEDKQDQRKAQLESKRRMREELERQQKEFKEKQELYKHDLQRFAREQSERNAIQDEMDRKRRQERMQKIQEIKQWRLEHARVKEEYYRS